MTGAFTGTGLTVPTISFLSTYSRFVLSPAIGYNIALDFNVQNSMGTAFGFFNLVYPTTGLSSVPLESVRAPILALTSGNLYIHTDLPNRYNLSTLASQAEQSSLLQVVIINAPYNAFITLDSMSYLTPMYVSASSINYFFVFLRDTEGRLIDLRGADWNITLEFTIERLPANPLDFERQEPSESVVDNIVNENDIRDIPIGLPVKRKRTLYEPTNVPSVPAPSSEAEPEQSQTQKISNYTISELINKFSQVPTQNE
jgi:hypothetical protein